MDETLGSVIRIYRDRPLRWRDLFTTFAPALLFAATPLAYGLYRYRDSYLRYGPIAARAWSWPWFALTAAALIPLLWLALLRVRRAHRVVTLHQRGLSIRWTGGKKHTLMWNQIEALSHRCVAKKFLGLTVATDECLSLHNQAEKPIRVDNCIRELPELAARVKAKVYPLLLPQLRTRFQQGEQLHFGPVTLHQDEIQLRGESIPWDQVVHIDVQAGHLMVKSQDHQPIHIKTSDIPNVDLLIQLLQEGAHT